MKTDQLEFFHSGTMLDDPKPGDKWDVPRFLSSNSSEWAKVLVKIYEHPMSFPGSVSPNMGNLLRALIMNIVPRTVVEVGSYIGISTLWIASAMADYEYNKKLYCIDTFPNHTDNPWCPGVTLNDPLEFMKENIKKCGYQDFVEIHKGDSLLLINELLSNILKPIDFVFIDGDHSKEGCLSDFLNIEKYIATGGYILFHDVFPNFCGVDGPFYTLQNKIIPSDKYEICQIYTSPLNFGFALIRKLK
ncbi:conserved hypothetical protein [Bathymodiolus platifrons methanotrophic gill symbiont]|uniref:class I SAM-dependent methyltransferase n=1 Tax=unclassified Gammaproteobacteria TaxID=33811 RepID=UPI000B4159F4|nr:MULTISPECIES: class I SAM-dependent methyltransferase [unclassified Gammaproteobacteria]GAW87804.1 conserved hypothetical protein [Bathymodiolus platifrons methanotrophic gill symbiont]GFO73237.1 hypothetical protein BJAS_P3948 [Bathymodiolus japonicus methanotrophic gill symbiont]GFO77941.1 hypothetical protein BPLS_P6694 [Bathymodiolus platifrons methanotrophic gill symbiont]